MVGGSGGVAREKGVLAPTLCVEKSYRPTMRDTMKSSQVRLSVREAKAPRFSNAMRLAQMEIRFQWAQTAVEHEA